MRVMSVVLIVAFLTGCAAVEGVGTTISNTGKALTKTSQKVKNALEGRDRTLC